MKKYSKLCLATLCFISSVSVFANGYKGEAPPLVPVSIPMFNGGFEFNIGAIYMQPETSNSTYLSSQYLHEPAGVNTVNARTSYDIDPSYQWGFVLGAGYIIPGTANDVKLDWMYFHNNYKASEFLLGTSSESSATNVEFFPTGATTLNGYSTLDSSATMNYKFDAVDLTFGQYLNMGSRLQTRLFTGLRYMRLDSDLSTSYGYVDNEVVTGPSPRVGLEQNWSGDIDSSFNGLGPLVGIKADLYLGTGFSLTGAIDGALLVGQLGLNANSQYVRTAEETADVWTVTDRSSNSLDWDNQNIIAPGFDAKFGLSYKYQFNNGTLLGLELGYQVTKYIDVVEQMDRNDVTTELAENNRFDTEVTDFRLAGPYLTLDIKV